MQSSEQHDDITPPTAKLARLELDGIAPVAPFSVPHNFLSDGNPSDLVSLDTPAGRIICAQTDVHREFMHIVLKSNSTDYGQGGGGGGGGASGSAKQKKPMITCDSHEGPFQTKWSLHFYPEGHPSNYSFHPDVEWFPAQYVPDDQKFASLYVRLKDGPYEMIEARMMTSVLSGESDMEAALATNMERFMLCPRMKVDEFHREAAGHGWPKLCLTNSLKNFAGGFICVVSLQVLQPASAGSPVTGVRRAPIPIRRYGDLGQEQEVPCIVRLRESTTQGDAVLQAADWQYVHAHRFVLAARSTYFRGLLAADQGVPFVYKSEHTLEELNYLLDMLYLNKLPPRDTALSVRLHDLAVMYELTFIATVLAEEIGGPYGSDSIESGMLSATTSSESMTRPVNPYEEFRI
ncbi:uncharacterized protein LOC129593362 [Paramacrobiotus metropolitanus]|uniref:uncharacterized protein LOC129593362 n=1 Tax=Paramacrobiotus metropolitanus TaxID=2943436 RepID=UPI0024456E7B|nr:uncharacterized protein LOC129593362 [Paramacrobiotus metropolitanus]